MDSRLLCMMACTAIALLGAGCSELPQKELVAAREAIEEAIEAGAEAYAPSQLQAAQVSFDLAKKEISVETRKLPFLRKYDKIVDALKSTTIAAQSARKAVDVAKKRITTETQDLMDKTKSLIDTLDTILIVAEKKKKDPGTLPSDLDSIKICAMQASTALGAGDLFLAKEKALEAHSRVIAAKAMADTLFPRPVKKIRARKR